MTSVDQTVKEFLYTWSRRKCGDLPPVDFKISCCRCGIEVIGDSQVAYSVDGLLCEACLTEGKRLERSK